MILVDTSVLVDFFRGTRNEQAAKLENIVQQGIPFGINSFIYQEVLQGAATNREVSLLKEYLGTHRFYNPKDPRVSFEEAAGIFFLCRRKGVTLRSTIDCLIAQTAIEHDLLLLHNDRDFDRIARVTPLKVLSVN